MNTNLKKQQLQPKLFSYQLDYVFPDAYIFPNAAGKYEGLCTH